MVDNQENTPKQRVFEVKKRVHNVSAWCRVTKGFYRNHKSWCPYKIDCDVIGNMFYLESLGTYFSEDYVTFNVEDNT